MANDLTTGSNATWIPPEAQKMSVFVKWGMVAAFVMAGVYAFTRFAPTMVDAVTLLDTILQDTTHMAVSGAILIGTILVLNETFSSTGKINMLLRMPYWIFVRWVTRQLITIDPFGTIDQRIAQVESDEETFDQQTQKVSGIVSRLQEQEDDCRQKAAQAQKIGIAAHQRGMKDAEELQTTTYEQYLETANTLAGMRAKLQPMLETFQRIAKACQNTGNKLKIERQTLQIKWDAQQAVSGAVTSANRILGRSKTQVWNLAEQASDIINSKYGDELGRLDHLKLVTEPLMESIDLQSATYNEDMLKAVQASGDQLIAASNAVQATPVPVPVAR